MEYNRYKKFIENGEVGLIPKIKLRQKLTDKAKIWNKEIDSTDALSEAYYGHSDGGWLIMLANPQYFDEFEISGGDLIRIPYPYQSSLQNYIDEVNRYKSLYG